MSSFDRPGVLALAGAQTVIWAGLSYSFPAMLPAMAADTGWPAERLAVVVTGALLASAGLSPLAGGLIDRGHANRLLPGAAAFGALLLIATTFTSGYPSFALVWIAIGACYAGALYDPAFTVLTRAYGAAARGPITVVTLVAGFAGTLAFPLCAGLISLGGWHLAARVMAGLVLVLGVPLTIFALRRLPEGAPPGDARAGAPRLLGRGAFWAIAVAFACLSLHAGAVITLILPLLEDRGVTPSAAVFAAASLGPMQVAGRLALMSLGAKRSAFGLATLAYCALILSIPTLLNAGAGMVFLAAFVLLHGAGVGVMSILRPLLVRAILGDDGYGRKAGWVGGASMLGYAAAPAAGGALVVWGGFETMLLAGGAALMLALLALVIAWRWRETE